MLAGVLAEMLDDAGRRHQKLRSTMTGYKLSQALYVVAKLRLADLLADGSARDVEALAAATEADRASLQRLLRLLAAAGYFAQDAAGQFRLTALGELLVSDAPRSDWAWILKEGELWREAWDHLLESVRTGQPGFDLAYGTGLFDYLADSGGSEVASRTLTALSSAGTDQQIKAIIDAYDFGAAETVVDVGGGNGALLFTILERHPGLRGVLFDLPYVVALTRIPDAVAGRCELMGGSFFDSLPAGVGDLYLLRSVLHDWDDDRALQILRSCRAAVGPGAHLLVVEILFSGDSGEDPLSIALRDVNLMVMTGGRKRTADELGLLLAEAGFDMRRLIPTGGAFSIIEAS
jgi:hypothetical protein